MKKREKPKRRIGEVFLEMGVINEKQLREGLEYSARWGKRLGISLVALGYLKEEDLVRALSDFFSVKEISLKEIKISKNVLDCVSQVIVEKYQVLPVGFEGEKLVFAAADPSDFDMIQNLEFVTGYPIRLLVASATELKAAVDHYYFGKPRVRPAAAPAEGRIATKEDLLNTIKDCLAHNVVSKEELISNLIDL